MHVREGILRVVQVLIIDDDPVAHRTWQRVLHDRPVQMLSALTVAQARQRLSAHGRSIDAIVLDERMDIGSGLDLVPDIRRHCPFAVVALVSAHLEAEIEIRAQALGLLVVSKPESFQKLVDLVPLLDRRSLVRQVFGGLSEREYEVLELAIGGHRNAEIARWLKITPRTVAAHREGIRARPRVARSAPLSREAPPLRARTGLTRFEVLCALIHHRHPAVERACLSD